MEAASSAFVNPRHSCETERVFGVQTSERYDVESARLVNRRLLQGCDHRNAGCKPRGMDLEIYLQTRAARTVTDANAVEIIRARLEKHRRYIRRLIVRFDETMNARTRVDKVCRIHVSLRAVRGIPSFIVEGRALHEREAAALAADELSGAIEERIGSLNAPVAKVQREEEPETARAGRDGVTPRAVKTAHPLRGRHIHKTNRQARATAARERSVPPARPSRKLTRKSANRMKRDSQQTLRATRRVRAAGGPNRRV